MSSQHQYELDSKQDHVIERLSRSMPWVASGLNVMGLLSAVGGIASLVGAFRQPGLAVGAVSYLLSAAFYLALGHWTRNAARSFQRVVSTTGQDVDRLTDGLDNIRKMYSLLSVIVKISLVVIVLALVTAVVGLAMIFFWI